MKSVKSKFVEAYWHQIVNDLAHPLFAKDGWDTIKSQYASPGRFYHTLDHVYDTCKSALELSKIFLAGDVEARNRILLTLIAHDMFYDVSAKDNEEKSAKWIYEYLEATSCAPKTYTKIKNMVLATAGHTPAHADIETLIVIESDLAVLGNTALDYHMYANKIRHEYMSVPAELYIDGRRKVMNLFYEIAKSEQLFILSPTLNYRATENISWELHNLPFLVAEFDKMYKEMERV